MVNEFIAVAIPNMSTLNTTGNNSSCARKFLTICGVVKNVHGYFSLWNQIMGDTPQHLAHNIDIGNIAAYCYLAQANEGINISTTV